MVKYDNSFNRSSALSLNICNVFAFSVVVSDNSETELVFLLPIDVIPSIVLITIN